MTRVNIKPATREDFYKIYQYYPHDNIYAWCAMCDEKVIGIAGIYISSCYDTFFLNIIENNLNLFDKFVIVRKIKEIILMIARETSLNLAVVRDIKIKNSDIFLKRLGFHYNHSAYGDEIWLFSKPDIMM